MSQYPQYPQEQYPPQYQVQYRQQHSGGGGIIMITLGMIISCLATAFVLIGIFGVRGNTAFQEQTLLQLGMFVMLFALTVLIVPGIYFASKRG